LWSILEPCHGEQNYAMVYPYFYRTFYKFALYNSTLPLNSDENWDITQ